MKFQETKAGQMFVTIPKNIRKRLKLKKHDEFNPYVNERGNIELEVDKEKKKSVAYGVGNYGKIGENYDKSS